VLKRDQLIAWITAELDAERHGRGGVVLDAWPDADDRTNPAVDFIGHDDVGEIAVEHTRIESFPGQIKDRLATEAVFPKLGPEVQGRRDAGKFVMWVRPGALSSVGFSQRPAVKRAVTAWVSDNLDRVPLGDVMLGEDPDVPFRWALQHWLPDYVGLAGPYATVVPIRYAPADDLDDRRAERMQQVVQSKLPKLAAAGVHGRRTLLVVEDKDQDLSAPKLVSRAIQRSITDTELPDAIYILHDGGGDPLLYPVYEDEAWAHDTLDAFWHQVPAYRRAQLRELPTPWA
jgi:hypothetical protein